MILSLSVSLSKFSLIERNKICGIGSFHWRFFTWLFDAIFAFGWSGFTSSYSFHDGPCLCNAGYKFSSVSSGASMSSSACSHRISEVTSRIRWTISNWWITISVHYLSQLEVLGAECVCDLSELHRVEAGAELLFDRESGCVFDKEHRSEWCNEVALHFVVSFIELLNLIERLFK